MYRLCNTWSASIILLLTPANQHSPAILDWTSVSMPHPRHLPHLQPQHRWQHLPVQRCSMRKSLRNLGTSKHWNVWNSWHSSSWKKTKENSERCHSCEKFQNLGNHQDFRFEKFYLSTKPRSLDRIGKLFKPWHTLRKGGKQQSSTCGRLLRVKHGQTVNPEEITNTNRHAHRSMGDFDFLLFFFVYLFPWFERCSLTLLHPFSL